MVADLLFSQWNFLMIIVKYLNNDKYFYLFNSLITFAIMIFWMFIEIFVESFLINSFKGHYFYHEDVIPEFILVTSYELLTIAEFA